MAGVIMRQELLLLARGAYSPHPAVLEIQSFLSLGATNREGEGTSSRRRLGFMKCYLQEIFN